MAQQTSPPSLPVDNLNLILETISEEIGRLRRAVSHWTESQANLEKKLDRQVSHLSRQMERIYHAQQGGSPGDARRREFLRARSEPAPREFLRARSEPAPRGGESGSGHDSGGGHDSQSGIGTPTRPNAIQVRALMEFDHAVRTLQLMADAEIRPDARIVLPKDAPRSIGEGIDLLHIRVHNLQRSFGMKPIKAIGRPFDPKLHEVRKTCSRLDLPDGQVAEELAPGFLLGTDVVRRAVVTVNRHRPSASPA